MKKTRVIQKIEAEFNMTLEKIEEMFMQFVVDEHEEKQPHREPMAKVYNDFVCWMGKEDLMAVEHGLPEAWKERLYWHLNQFRTRE